MFFGEKAPTQEPGVGASPLEGATEEGSPPPNSGSSAVEEVEEHVFFPPGLVGEVASYFYEGAEHQSQVMALAGAIGLLSGLTGRAYKTFTYAGVNQYILMLAGTGAGKTGSAPGRHA